MSDEMNCGKFDFDHSNGFESIEVRHMWPLPQASEVVHIHVNDVHCRGYCDPDKRITLILFALLNEVVEQKSATNHRLSFSVGK
jgi:hypothetical protein